MHYAKVPSIEPGQTKKRRYYSVVNDPEQARSKQSLQDKDNENSMLRARLQQNTDSYAQELRDINDKLAQTKASEQQLKGKLKTAREKLKQKSIREGVCPKKRLCALCFEEAEEIQYFLPCRHSGSCKQCTSEWMVTSRECPFCRRPVTSVHGVLIMEL